MEICELFQQFSILNFILISVVINNTIFALFCYVYGRSPHYSQKFNFYHTWDNLPNAVLRPLP